MILCDPCTAYVICSPLLFTATESSSRNQNTYVEYRHILVTLRVGGPNKLIRSRHTLPPKNFLILTLTQPLLPPNSSSMRISLVDFRSKLKRPQECVSRLSEVGSRAYGRWSRRKLWETPQSIGRAGKESDKYRTGSFGRSELFRSNDLRVGKGGIIVEKDVLLFLFSFRSSLII